MDKFYTTKIREINSNNLITNKIPKNSTLDFIKQYARAYSYVNVGNGEINNFIVN